MKAGSSCCRTLAASTERPWPGFPLPGPRFDIASRSARLAKRGRVYPPNSVRPARDIACYDPNAFLWIPRRTLRCSFRARFSSFKTSCRMMHTVGCTYAARAGRARADTDHNAVVDGLPWAHTVLYRHGLNGGGASGCLWKSQDMAARLLSRGASIDL